MLLRALLTFTLLHSVLIAATDGTVGTSSTGDLDISMTKGDEVRISNLSNINFGSNNNTPAGQTLDVCIYSSTGSYDITATSSNGNGTTFRLANGGASSFIEYDVQWNNTASGNNGTDLNNAVTSGVFTGANTTQNDCGGGVNSRLFVDVVNSSFNAAPSDNYTDTLTLVITPQ
jgi:spore coat protein U-like protein